MHRRSEQLESHQAWLRRLARSMAGSRASADDLVQDTCLTALCKAPAGDDLRPWLRGVMRRLAVRNARSERRRAGREESAHRASPSFSAPEPLLELGLDRERLVRAVGQLPEPLRSTIVERFAAERSCTDIARAEGLPASTVRWRLARALELLRAELDAPRPGRPARRRPALWWLPLAGASAGQVIAARARRLVAALLGHSKVVMLGLACLAAALGLGLIDRAGDPGGAGHTAARARGERRAGDGRLPAPWRPDPLLRGGGGQVLVSVASHGPAAHAIIGGRERAGGDARLADSARLREATLRAALTRAAHAPDQRAAIDVTSPGGATCELIRRTRALIDPRRQTPMAFRQANRFLMAALLANQALAASLGCGMGADQEGSGPSALAGDIADGSSCTTTDGPDGAHCTTCADPDGGHTTMCAPAECREEARPDGTTCTTCTDASGHESSACEDPPGCTSEVDSFGVLCTTCPGEAGPTTECLPAECLSFEPGCLACTDPKGRTATLCDGADYADGGVLGYQGSYFFAGCDTIYGFFGSETTCEYPGRDTCHVALNEFGQHCLVCSTRFGSWSPLCYYDEADLPDPLDGRPANLPGPGTCISETREDGQVSCTTCTREDLSATMTCTHPPSQACGILSRAQEGKGLCVACVSANNLTDVICDPQRFD